MRGGDKLLEPVAGQPLLSLMCARAMASGLPTIVTLPHPNHPRADCIGGATAIWVPNAREGMGVSIATGVAALPDSMDGVMLLPTDMPEVSTADYAVLAQAFQGPDGPVIRATAQGGTPGHPVLFPRRLFSALQDLRGDTGARGILRTERVIPIPLPDRHALVDLDTPEDWATWRASQAPDKT